MSRGYFDRRMNELINATRDLATDQHRDNLKLEANVGVNQQIVQDMMQFLVESIEGIKDSHKDLQDKMVHMSSRIVTIEAAAENSSNDALERGETTDVKTLITGMAEEVKKYGRSMADYAKVSEKLEGFLRENQSPMVRQDAKRQKRVRVQSPTPETIDLERVNNVQTPNQQAPASTPQATPARVGTQNAAPQRAVPPGTVLRNGSLATTIMGPNGTQVLRKPGPGAANPTTTGTAPPNTTRTLRDGNRVSTYLAEDGRETLRLPRPRGTGTKPEHKWPRDSP